MAKSISNALRKRTTRSGSEKAVAANSEVGGRKETQILHNHEEGLVRVKTIFVRLGQVSANRDERGVGSGR